MKRFYIAKLSPKGQITIPSQCLRDLGWVKGRTTLTRATARGAAIIASVKEGGRRGPSEEAGR